MYGALNVEAAASRCTISRSISPSVPDGLSGGGDGLHGTVGDPEHQAGEDAEDDDEDEHRRPGEVLGHVDVVDVTLLELRLGHAEGGALVHPQQVTGGEDGADGRYDHVAAEQPGVETLGGV